MEKYSQLFIEATKGYWNYLSYEITHPRLDNYFYILIAISLIVWGLEIVFPWRKKQSIFRKDFWLDCFYMFFNFFIFNLIVFIGLSSITESLLLEGLDNMGIELKNLQLFDLGSTLLPYNLIFFFIITDFIQWSTHILLHKSKFLWQFHKVHHSVKEMGFAAHLRYHWAETIVYKTILYIPLAIIGGFNVQQVIFVHVIAISIGHLNHANFSVNIGPLKYIFNNAKMHIWHHVKELPSDRKDGMNYGISLSIWDYIFRTAYIPKDGKDIVLGFNDDKNFPKNFIRQELYPLGSKKQS